MGTPPSTISGIRAAQDCSGRRSTGPNGTSVSLGDVLILLPPSETKAPGGRSGPLDLDTLAFPELNPVREQLLDSVTELATDVDASLAALGLSAQQRDQVERNAELYKARTLPAIRRYTGVLYDAIDIASFTRAERSRADRRLATASALFGVVRAGDAIPAYRLSADSRLPGMPTLRSLWRPALTPALAAVDELVVDLRSGPYAALARVDGAVTVRVSTLGTDGRKATVSHHNKAHKGRLAAIWARVRREPSTVDDLLAVAAAADCKLEQHGPRELELLV